MLTSRVDGGISLQYLHIVALTNAFDGSRQAGEAGAHDEHVEARGWVRSDGL